MHRYLLFDEACSRCSGLAADVALESDGLLTTRSLHGAEMRAVLDRERPGWTWEPTLLEMEGERVRIFTGLALRAKLVAILGARRAWAVARLVAEEQTPITNVDSSRRTVIKRGASLAAGVVGLALLGTSAAGAATRPGRYSRREGIESWKVNKTPSGAVVTFTHKKRTLSGKVQVTFGGGGKTTTTELTRRGDRVQFGLSGSTFSATDGKGGSATGRMEGRRWDVSAASERVLRESRTDFRLAIAVARDMSPAPRRASATSGTSATTPTLEHAVGWVQAQTTTVPNCINIPDGTCSRTSVKGTTFPVPSLGRDEDCVKATFDMDDRCIAISGRPCCCRVDCWCICLSALGSWIPGVPDDLLCGCDRTGYTYP
jgi:hypothetical protein